MKPLKKTKIYLFFEDRWIRYKVRKRYLSVKEFIVKHKGKFKTLAFCALLLYLIIGNWSNIIDPPKAAIGYKEIAKQIMLTEVNLQIMAVGAMYAVATGAVFLLRLPFLKIESLKVPGFEYTAKLEQQENIAKVDMSTLQELESARLAFIKTFEDGEIFREFSRLMIGGNFDIYLTSDLLARTIENFFIDRLDIVLPVKALLIQNKEIVDEDQFYHESPLVRNLVQEVLENGGFAFAKKSGHSAIAVLLTIEEYPENQGILYAESIEPNLILGESDCSMVEISWTQIKHMFYIEFLNEELEKRPS